jgi:glucosamine--fructose-6-phosphate aminotransferase (isomerizing)
MKEEKKDDAASKMCVVHSRYASKRGTIRDQQAHPVFDEENRVAVFHNGFVTNFKELTRELFPKKDPAKVNLTDSELIAVMLGKELDSGADLKTAITTLVEKKLIGTWRMAIVPVKEPNLIYFIKNAGQFFIGKSEESVVVCSDQEICQQYEKQFTFTKMKNNELYEVKDNCEISTTTTTKKISVERKPAKGFNHIFEEEIMGSIDAASTVTDDGSKFISNH